MDGWICPFVFSFDDTSNGRVIHQQQKQIDITHRKCQHALTHHHYEGPSFFSFKTTTTTRPTSQRTNEQTAASHHQKPNSRTHPTPPAASRKG
mmetsp:Transcript_21870/g.53609  ORF Transcript_21870/g.53609 Transcript_21870/m.53609 type:complete len:93 (+) Transcript_21870:141-419(+)